MLVALLPGAAHAAGTTTSWSIVASPNEEGWSWLQAVDAAAADDAWSVGYYIGADGVEESLAEHWDGATWSLVDTPSVGPRGDQLYGVAAVSPSDAWAVGYAAGKENTYTSKTVIEHWTGAAWSLVPSPNPSKDPLYGANQLYDVRAFASNDVWAAGWQWTETGYAPLIERWDGTSWTVSRTPSAGFRQVQALDGTSSNDLWAAGFRSTYAHGSQSLILHWNGSTWSIVPTPILPYDNYLNGVTALSATDAWAVGYSRDGLDIQPYVLHWDGSRWTTASSPHLSSTYNFLQTAVAVSPGDVWAAGYRTVNGRDVTFVEHWDGARWRIDRTRTCRAEGTGCTG